MNLGEIKARVQTILGDDSGVIVTPDDLGRWINDAQLEIVRKTGCLEDFIEIDVEAGTDSYPLPHDFLKDRRLTLSGLKLTRTTLEELDLIVPNRDISPVVSTSIRYYIYGRNLFLYPVPVSTVTDGLKLWYTYSPTTMVADNDTPQIPLAMHKDLVTYAVAQGYQTNEDFGSAQAKSAEFEQQVNFSRDEFNDNHKDTYPAVRLIAGDS